MKTNNNLKKFVITTSAVKMNLNVQLSSCKEDRVLIGSDHDQQTIDKVQELMQKMDLCINVEPVIDGVKPQIRQIRKPAVNSATGKYNDGDHDSRPALMSAIENIALGFYRFCGSPWVHVYSSAWDGENNLLRSGTGVLAALHSNAWGQDSKIEISVKLEGMVMEPAPIILVKPAETGWYILKLKEFNFELSPMVPEQYEMKSDFEKGIQKFHMIATHSYVAQLFNGIGFYAYVHVNTLAEERQRSYAANKLHSLVKRLLGGAKFARVEKSTGIATGKRIVRERWLVNHFLEKEKAETQKEVVKDAVEKAEEVIQKQTIRIFSADLASSKLVEIDDFKPGNYKYLKVSGNEVRVVLHKAYASKYQAGTIANSQELALGELA